MKKFYFFLLLIIACFSYLFFSCAQQSELSSEKQIALTLVKQVDSFSTLINSLETATKQNNEQQKLQQIFLDARIAYKKFEWAAEYFEPTTSRFVNGPPVEEIEINGQIFEPAGLQVIEALLFPNYNLSVKSELIKQLKLLQLHCKKFKTHFSKIDILNWQVFDATKLEVFRIETLSIAGFDNPLSLKSMQECTASLKSIQQVLLNYDNGKIENINKAFIQSINYLKSNADFNCFNRAEFIRTYCNPLSAGIESLQEKLNINSVQYNRLLNQKAKTLFDTDAFNANAYSSYSSSYTASEKIELGKKLFSDPILSENGLRSCKSCHQPEKSFTDGLVKNTIINNNHLLKRNTPTLINAALQSAQFYDMRANTLEEQAIDVVQNKAEMHGSMKLAVQTLWNDTLYRKLFAVAYPKANRKNIDTTEVTNAIGSYVRSLVSLNSRLDEYMRGDNTAMSNNEVNGFNLFMGKAKCATCHYIPLFNGTFPPRYMQTEAEVIGVPQSVNSNKIDSDMGRYDILKAASVKHAFKIPTLRNAEYTAPYMHNGVFKSLNEVIDFYNKGGGAGLGMDVQNQTLSSDKLNLSKQEINNLIAFIKCLSNR